MKRERERGVNRGNGKVLKKNSKLNNSKIETMNKKNNFSSIRKITTYAPVKRNIIVKITISKMTK